MFESIHPNSAPFIVAGPCSAESFEQLESIARAFSVSDSVSLIRCGVWKPRTRPGGFEGMGEKALAWIFALKKDYPNLAFCVEVASPQHVEQVLRYGIDAVWIGARTSGNPFSMAELAESLRGVSLPVMVKNPMVPDLKLWVGAIERLHAVGIHDIAAIHRGFCTPNNSDYRNDPVWEIPIELRRNLPDMPLLCDPSHIGGSRSLILPVSLKAIDLDFDGLMIETHPNPSEALTDASQQVTPRELFDLLSQLPSHQHDANSSELTLWREKISEIDNSLISLLADRMDISRRIGDIKRLRQMAIYQPRQWDKKLEQCQQKARQMGLSETFISQLFNLIHLESIQVQEKKNTSDKGPVQ